MTTFDEARAKLAAATGNPVAEHGWENDETYVMAIDHGENLPPFDQPDYLVDKATGELTEVFGMLGHDPVPHMRPIGTVPD
jgi:hypothetical protein